MPTAAVPAPRHAAELSSVPPQLAPRHRPTPVGLGQPLPPLAQPRSPRLGPPLLCGALCGGRFGRSLPTTTPTPPSCSGSVLRLALFHQSSTEEFLSLVGNMAAALRRRLQKSFPPSPGAGTAGEEQPNTAPAPAEEPEQRSCHTRLTPSLAAKPLPLPSCQAFRSDPLPWGVNKARWQHPQRHGQRDALGGGGASVGDTRDALMQPPCTQQVSIHCRF